MATRYKINEEEIKSIKETRKKNRDKNAEKRLQVMEMSAVGKKAAVIRRLPLSYYGSIKKSAVLLSENVVICLLNSSGLVGIMSLDFFIELSFRASRKRTNNGA